MEPRSIITLGVRDLQWSVQIGEAERNGGKLLQRGERGGEKYAYVADPGGYVIEL